jgi:hypothetical protein
MNFNRFNSTLLLGTAAFFVASCDLVKDITYTVNPNPLQMHGDSVKVSITVNVPEKGIQKKAKAEITPKLGSTAVGTWYINGSKVTGNGTTIDFKTGGTATFEQTLAYTPSMEAADLVITGKLYKPKKKAHFQKPKLPTQPSSRLTSSTKHSKYLPNKTLWYVNLTKPQPLPSTLKKESPMYVLAKSKTLI